MTTKVKAKSRAKKDTTKAELITVITKKTSKIPARFQPAVKRSFLTSLRYKKKSELRRIASKMRIEVDKTGYDISWS